MPGLQPGDIIPEALSWEKFELHMLGAEVINFSGFEVGSEAEIAINLGKGGEEFPTPRRATSGQQKQQSTRKN